MEIFCFFFSKKSFTKESESRVDFNQQMSFPSIAANRWLAVRLEMVGALVVLFACLFAVLARETINPAVVGLSISYALQISHTLGFLVRMTAEVETNIVAIERGKLEESWSLLVQHKMRFLLLSSGRVFRCETGSGMEKCRSGKNEHESFFFIEFRTSPRVSSKTFFFNFHSFSVFYSMLSSSRILNGHKRVSSSLETSKFVTEKDLTWFSRESISR